MLNLIKAELIKLKRKRIVWFMMSASLIMPILAVIYFHNTDMSNNAVKYFKWTIFSYNLWIILPILLGIFSTMLVNVEHEYGIFKELWTIPVGKFKLLLSKFATVLIYSLIFMLLSVFLTVVFGIGFLKISIGYQMYLFLIRKCFEISLLVSVSMIPILSVAFLQGKYILPVCFTIIYAFSGFILLMVNMHVHPLSSVTVIVLRDVSGVILPQEINIINALACIGIWVIGFIMLSGVMLKRRDW